MFFVFFIKTSTECIIAYFLGEGKGIQKPNDPIGAIYELPLRES